MLNQHVRSDYRSRLGADNQRASKLLALVGANGCGKTNILKSLAFVHWFVSHSFTTLEPQAAIPVTPHFLGVDQPTAFSIEFELDQQVWRYNLELTDQRVLHESLYRYDYRFAYIFKRDWDEKRQGYRVVAKPEFDLPRREALRVRQNTSLIATAAQYNVPMAIALSQLNVVSNINSLGRVSLNSVEQLLQAAESLNSQIEIFDGVGHLLRNWDLGLSGLRIKEQTGSDERQGKKKVYLPYGLHTIDNHEFELPLFNESSGTRSAFTLLSKVLPVLKSGGVAVIDELESDLHPHMLATVLDLFVSPETNPHDAQLLFSTHSHEIMNGLLKEQILLVEKDSRLNTDAYRLDEVEGVRSDDNYYAKYMAGAYGAVPEL